MLLASISELALHFWDFHTTLAPIFDMHNLKSRTCYTTSSQQTDLPYLVFVQLTVFVLSFTLLLESYNDETYKDVHHEKGNENEIDYEEDGNAHAIVVYGAHVFRMGINCFIQ